MSDWVYPDYQGRSIVNLMSSIMSAYGHESSHYPTLMGLPPDKLQEAHNIVLLVIDGLGYDYLIQHGSNSTLQQYLQDSITSVAPPTTATAISTFLTGLAPQQHGLTGWYTYFRELGSVLAVLPFKVRCGGIALGTAGINAEALFGHVPVFNYLNVRSYSISPDWIAMSDFNRAHLGCAELVTYRDVSQCFSSIAQSVRAHNERKYIYAYWPGFDSLAHEHGVESTIVRSHLNELDTCFTKLLADLAETDTLVVVTADHGFVDVPPERVIQMENHPELKNCLYAPLCGEPRLAYAYVRAEQRQTFEQYVYEYLDNAIQLYTSEALRERNLYGLGQAHPELASRTGDYTLVMKEGYVIKDQIPGEGPFAMLGYHGGLSTREMHVPLIVARC
jgi:hypothetical protein